MSQPSSSGEGPGPSEDSARWFAHGAAGNTCPPSGSLADFMADLAGDEWRCPGVTDDELAGMLDRWQAVGSWVEAAKLGLIREMIRRAALGGRAGPVPRDLPEFGAWAEGLSHEVAQIFGCSLAAADKTVLLAWELEARIPNIGALLADGTLSIVKVMVIAEEFRVLDEEKAAAAERLLLDELYKREGQAALTPGKLGRLAQRLTDTVDPEGARKRREEAEREEARVRFWRQHGGAAGMAARGLPADEALRANAAIDARARAYKREKLYPSARLDQLRVLALLDKINGTSFEARAAKAAAEAAAKQQPDTTDGSHDDRGGNTNGGGDSDEAGDGGRGGGDSGGDEPDPGLPANTNLTIPLLTVLRLAERPGEAHGLGSLDPALARDLANAAARSRHSEFCVTVTDFYGQAVGHACARPRRRKPPGGGRDGPPGTWAFTRQDASGPPGGYGTWLLTLPDGREFIIEIEPVPTETCDHRHESHAYQPNDQLRHLVQVRDGECTHPCCSRHARESDFEHAVPYDQGGRTCACNAGVRSRRCHRVKQSKGWTVTQPRPGWHHWTAPSGRTYIQGPMQYPA
jgi:hypothetical protein